MISKSNVKFMVGEWHLAHGDYSKTGTRNFWFRFHSARASDIVVEMKKFQQPMRFRRLFGGPQSIPEVSIPGADQKDRGHW